MFELFGPDYNVMWAKTTILSIIAWAAGVLIQIRWHQGILPKDGTAPGRLWLTIGQVLTAGGATIGGAALVAFVLSL